MQQFQSYCSAGIPASTPPGIFSTKHEKIQDGKSDCFTITSRQSAWIQLSKTSQKQEAGTAQHFTAPFRVFSRSFPCFTGELCCMTVQHSQKCCGGSFPQQANRKTVRGAERWYWIFSLILYMNIFKITIAILIYTSNIYRWGYWDQS